MSSDKHVSVNTYCVIFSALLVLTLATVAAAEVEFGAWHTPIALGIAVLKATLVVLFFMHVIHSSRLTVLVIFSSLLMLAILLVITLSDYLTRGWFQFYL
jgi:cytochrome c oxidase subunit 4